MLDRILHEKDYFKKTAKSGEYAGFGTIFGEYAVNRHVI